MKAKLLKNKSNFLKVLHLLAKHDEELQSRLILGPKNASYTSPNMQNFFESPW